MSCCSSSGSATATTTTAHAGGGCGCGCSHDHASQARDTRRVQDLPIPGTRSASNQTQAGDQFTVTGMTCGHCASSVAKAVGALPGVRDVHVDVASGRLDLDADQPVSRADVADAVRRAGYQLA